MLIPLAANVGTSTVTKAKSSISKKSSKSKSRKKPKSDIEKYEGYYGISNVEVLVMKGLTFRYDTDFSPDADCEFDRCHNHARWTIQIRWDGKLIKELICCVSCVRRLFGSRKKRRVFDRKRA